jgi:hypothetical protein
MIRKALIKKMALNITDALEITFRIITCAVKNYPCSSHWYDIAS